MSTDRTETKRQSVQTALARLRLRQEPITVAGVAGEAGVSRNFIYTQPDLKASIETLRSEPRPRPEPAGAQALRAENARLRERLKVSEQKTTDLDRQLRRTWGAAVESVPNADLTQRITDLETRNATLARQLGETEDALRESNEALDEVTDQLAAARAANRELTKTINQ